MRYLLGELVLNWTTIINVVCLDCAVHFQGKCVLLCTAFDFLSVKPIQPGPADTETSKAFG